MFVFWKIWRSLFSCYLRFEIRPFALLPTNSLLTETNFCSIAYNVGALRYFSSDTYTFMENMIILFQKNHGCMDG